MIANLHMLDINEDLNPLNRQMVKSLAEMVKAVGGFPEANVCSVTREIKTPRHKLHNLEDPPDLLIEQKIMVANAGTKTTAAEHQTVLSVINPCRIFHHSQTGKEDHKCGIQSTDRAIIKQA